ncbi:hypothetical protein AJ80_00937 [Polytolypa hystricis UAMH7299]|uniref:Rhodopsin domain-containing protein n=1 Tax=Polytolypa hystricis (strain UAMH7299) TaxID=1447883 RepID=A0A2B7Z2V6_POLH7|nr:hypothetical protein AJ80_00937 [Polytolypa hystricis UAMH7299]
MRNPPPEVVASWPKPNYVDPEYQGPAMTIIGIVFLAISVVVVCLRLWVRVYMRRSSGWDDWVMVATMPFVVGITVTTILGTHYGWGLHIWDVKPEWIAPSRLTSWLSQLQFIIIMSLVKLSILASYLRIATSKTFVRLTWSLIALNIAWGIAFMFTLVFTCMPVHHYWTALADQRCGNESSRVLAGTITNIITDILVLVLPMPTLWKLQLPAREKVVLIALMSLGLIACGASVVRAYYMYVSVDLTYDVTWMGYYIWVWNAIEVNLAVICASVPTLRPFIRRYLPYLGFRHSSRSRYGTHDERLQTAIYKSQTIHQVTTQGPGDAHSSTEALREEAFPMTNRII